MKASKLIKALQEAQKLAQNDDVEIYVWERHANEIQNMDFVGVSGNGKIKNHKAKIKTGEEFFSLPIAVTKEIKSKFKKH